jgi:phosphoglycolate phosphatase-like HAD superfamily hydrolase
MSRRLVLFDIDGTLVTDGGASREAFDAALRTTYGYDGDLRRYDFSGRTDPQITYMVLRDAGLSDEVIESKLEELWDVYLSGLERNLSTGRARALEGVMEVVARLHEHADVHLALLTGNLERGARLKLDAPGLNAYFPFGAFGSDSSVRTELPPFAVQRAEQHLGQRFSGRDVVIIGDSIYDVRCGVPHDATTIAVASGRTAGDVLRAENPTHYFDSLRDTDAVVQAILG